MTCADAQPLISRLLDGELPDADAAAVFSHLSACPECRGFMRDAVRIQSAVRAAALRPFTPTPAALPARLRPPAWVSYVAVVSAAAAFIVVGVLGTLAVMRFQPKTVATPAERVVWVLPEREITPSSIHSTWR